MPLPGTWAEMSGVHSLAWATPPGNVPFVSSSTISLGIGNDVRSVARWEFSCVFTPLRRTASRAR